MEGFHHEPRTAGVFVPGHAAASIGEVSGLAKTPSADVLMTLPTLEMGKSTSNLSLEGGAPTPKRLDMSPHGLPPTLRDGYSQTSMASESPTIPGDLNNVAPATVKVPPPPELPPGSSSSTPEQSTKTEPAETKTEPAETKTETKPAEPAVETPQPPPPPATTESPNAPKAPALARTAPAGAPPGWHRSPGKGAVHMQCLRPAAFG